MIKGQDWASFQSNTPDITGLDFAWVKITEGLGYTNPHWVAQRDWAKKHGLVWGGYHYPHMANDPKAEADFFLSQVLWKPGDMIALDWEGYDAANHGVTDARKLEYRDEWLAHVKSKMTSYRVGMYCNVDYWKNIDKTSNCGDFLWIADYVEAGKPRIGAPWKFHQYSSNPLDKDVANFNSRAELAAWAAGSTSTSSGGTDMTISKADLDALVHTDGVIGSPDPAGTPEGNLQWTWESYIRYAFLQDRETNANVKELQAQSKSNGEQISALAAKVDSLSVGGVDLDALAVKVADLLAKRLQS